MKSPANFNATTLETRAAAPYKTGDEVYYVFNLGARWEARGPVVIVDVRSSGRRFRLADHETGWFFANHLFDDKRTAQIAAEQLTRALKGAH